MMHTVIMMNLNWTADEIVDFAESNPFGTY